MSRVVRPGWLSARPKKLNDPEELRSFDDAVGAIVPVLLIREETSLCSCVHADLDLIGQYVPVGLETS